MPKTQGVTTGDAAAKVGVSTPVGSRWFRHAGGMTPICLAKPTGATCLLPSGRRSPSWSRRATARGKSPNRSGGTQARSLVSCAATRPRGLGSAATAPRWRSGRRSRSPSARRRPSSPTTRGYGPTSRTSLLVRLPMPTGGGSRVRTCPGPAAVLGAGRTGVGGRHGPRSRSATV